MYIYEHNPSPEAQQDKQTNKQNKKQISQRRNINMINVSAHMLSIHLLTADMSRRASVFRILSLLQKESTGEAGWGGAVVGRGVCVCGGGGF